ncbi:MAG: putative porin [Hyphomicrobiales bacterium]
MNIKRKLYTTFAFIILFTTIGKGQAIEGIQDTTKRVADTLIQERKSIDYQTDTISEDPKEIRSKERARESNRRRKERKSFFHNADTTLHNDSLKVKDQVIDSLLVQYFIADIDSLSLGNLHTIDTSINYIQDYDPKKPNPHFYESIGNIGLPVQSKLFSVDDNIGFDQRTQTVDPYLYKNEKVKYYKLYYPYSQLEYYNGPEKEQYLKVIHSQNFFKNTVNFGLDFTYLYSPGTYRRALADVRNIVFTGQYYTKKKRYGVIANYIHNKNRWFENGGIKYDTTFSQNTETDRLIIPVQLDSAFSMVKTASVYVNQYFNLGGAPEVVKDSTGKKHKKFKFNFGRINHEFQWSRNIYTYNDEVPTSDFYKPYAVPINKRFTYDSTYLLQVTNEFTYNNLGYEEKPEDKNVYFYLGGKFEYSKLGGFVLDRTYSQFIPKAGFALKVLRSSYLKADAAYNLGDYNKDNFYLRANISQYIGTEDRNLGKLNAYANFTHKSPSWFFQEYHANNFDWKNSFEVEEYINLGGFYNVKGFTAGMNILRLTNYIYLDENVKPQQELAGMNLVKFYLLSQFNFGKFNLKTNLYYQRASNKDIIRAPEFIGNVIFSFTSPVYQGMAVVQPGIELTYNSEYYGNKYMPALRSFHLQNDVKIGGYPYLDVFLNLKVQRSFTVFIKYAHVNGFLNDTRYYGSPTYPFQDAALRWGLRWIFHD